MARTLAGSNPRQDYCRYNSDKKQDRRELVVVWHRLYLLKNAGLLLAEIGRSLSGRFRPKADGLTHAQSGRVGR